MRRIFIIDPQGYTENVVDIPEDQSDPSLPDGYNVSNNPGLDRIPVLSPITPRQIRLQLLDLGITSSMVEGAIAQIENATDRARAEIEWSHAVSYDRTDPLVNQIGAAFSLSPSQIDAAWAIAQTL